MDGYLKIKTKIDNSNVDKGIIQLENKIKKLQTDNTKQSQQQDSLQAEIDKYEQITQKAEEYRQKIKKLEQDKSNMVKNNPNLVVSNTPEYTNLNTQLDEIKAKYANVTAEIDKQAPKIEKVNSKLSKIKAKQIENNNKIAEFRHQIEQINMNNMKNSIDSVGKKITGNIRKLGKMALAVAGIRTAWMGVRRIISTVSSYDSQVSTDLEYMRYAISNIFAPAVQGLIKLLYTVLSYVNAITTAWFGINLFANSSAKSFQKMKSSAKEIQKSLQGFDEMNLISDSSSSGSNAGIPSMDLSGMQGEVPAWLQWIIDNKDLIFSILGRIAAGILAIKFGLSGIKALGIGVLVTGIIKLIQDLQEYLEDPSWENFGKIIKDIGLIILGLGIIIGGVPAIIAGVVTIIVGLIASNWDKIKEMFQKAIDWIDSKMDWIGDDFGIFGQWIAQIFKGTIQFILNLFDGLFTGVKQILDGIIMIFKGDFKGGIEKIAKGLANILIGIINSVTAGINALIFPIRALIVGAGKITGKNWTLDNISIPKIPLLAQGTVVSRATPAIIGEAGAEAVVPLENNLEWLDVLADKLASKIGNGGGSYIIQMDSRTIQRGIAKKQRQISFAKNGR